MFDNPLNIIAAGSGVGLMSAGIGFAYAQFKSGAGKAKDDLITTLKDTALVEREKANRLADEKTTLIQSHQLQINELTQKIGKLEGMADANERKVKEYMDILQGRSPEQQKFMEYMTMVAGESAKYMKESSEILAALQTFMLQINNEVAKGNRFNQAIEEDTKKGRGKPLLKAV